MLNNNCVLKAYIVIKITKNKKQIYCTVVMHRRAFSSFYCLIIFLSISIVVQI